MKNNKKLNEGCLKIFQFLQLLYEDKADYEKVADIFKDNTKESSVNNIQVNLNKYINTLKVFGMKIAKVENKFKIQSSLYSMDFSEGDLRSLSLLIASMSEFPSQSLSEGLETFIENIELRMKNKDKNTLNNMKKNNKYDFSFYYSSLREQIEQCENICKNKFTISVLYKKAGMEISSKGTPKEVIYDSKNAYLRIYEAVTMQLLELPINSILSIAVLPQKANNIEMSATVVYKLKNRLAKTYKVKENEHSDGYDAEGNLIVINKKEPFDKLLARLMRYSFNCEIISPKSLRYEMLKKIEETLENYSED